MALFKNAYALIAEMGKAENYAGDEDLTVQMSNIDFGDVLDDMETITMGELEVKVEMVVVRECTRLGKDLVELDELAKFMQSNKIRSFKEAVEKVAEANGRDVSKMAIVIDEEAIRSGIQEAGYSLKCPDDVFRKAKVQGVVNMKKVLDMLYDNGLNVVKK